MTEEQRANVSAGNRHHASLDLPNCKCWVHSKLGGFTSESARTAQKASTATRRTPEFRETLLRKRTKKWIARRIDEDGRVFIWNPAVFKKNGWTPRARWIAARLLKRTLGSNEIVHHIDANPGNDKPVNLAIITKALHFAIHTLLRVGIEADLTQMSVAYLREKQRNEY